jgi:nicotinate-nucleotide adenylyltransferase
MVVRGRARTEAGRAGDDGAPAPGLAVLGGAFDPPHDSHCRLLQVALQRLPIDRLLVIPAGDHPHKPGTALSAASHRLAMCRLAFAGLPEVEVDDREVRRGGVSFTIDTLAELAAEHPGRRLFFLIGSDNLPLLPTWRDHHRILQLATVVTYPRAGFPVGPAALQGIDLTAAERARLLADAIDLPADDVAATTIRAQFRRRRGRAGGRRLHRRPRSLPRVITALPAAPIAAAAVLLGELVNRRLWGWLPDDPPRPGRKQHQHPMPLAGIVLLPVLLPWLLGAGLWWLAGAVAAVAVLGFVDDRHKERERDLDWRIKTVVLVGGAALATATVVDPRAEPVPFLFALGLVFVVTNATNFLDNTDGVSCAVSAASLLLLAPDGGPFAAAGCAALGFLCCNWPRPRVFLGDAGAYQLGLLVAIAVLPGARADLAALANVAVQLVDFAQVVTARLVIGVAPWIGDRRHLTHITRNLGVPRVLIAPLFAALAVAAGLAVAPR